MEQTGIIIQLIMGEIVSALYNRIKLNFVSIYKIDTF